MSSIRKVLILNKPFASNQKKILSKAQLLNRNSKNDQFDDRARQSTEQISDYRFFTSQISTLVLFPTALSG